MSAAKTQRHADLRRAAKCALAVLLLVAVQGSGTVAAEPADALGKAIKNFTLPDVHGRAHALADYKDRVLVLAFLGTECPLAKNYAPRLRDLAAEFEKRGVAFLGVDANLQDSLTEMAALARASGIKFPLLKDNNNQLADAVGALRTPEVFVLDRQHVVRYRGRIDDQYGLTATSGYAKAKQTTAPGRGGGVLHRARDESRAARRGHLFQADLADSAEALPAMSSAG
jgi:peroxiredoxin